MTRRPTPGLRASERLREMVRSGATLGELAAQEQAAWAAGATMAETEEILGEGGDG